MNNFKKTPNNKEIIEIYNYDLPLYKKIDFITNFIYKNMKLNKIDLLYNIEEFESDYEEISEDENCISEYDSE